MTPRLITVAVTGPTGEIGASAVDALERDPRVGRILGMARRPFDPAERGWLKTEYRQGDILDAAAVQSFVDDADVVVHLAYLIMGSRQESRPSTSRGPATCSRQRWRLRARAGWCTPPRSPPTATTPTTRSR